MESVMYVLSYLFMSLLFATVPAAAVGVWIYKGKIFRSLEKDDRQNLLVVAWLLFAMVAYQYIYQNLDIFAPLAMRY